MTGAIREELTMQEMEVDNEEKGIIYSVCKVEFTGNDHCLTSRFFLYCYGLF